MPFPLLAAAGRYLAEQLVSQVAKTIEKDIAERVAEQLRERVAQEVKAVASKMHAHVELDLGNLEAIQKGYRKAVFAAHERAAKPVLDAVVSGANRVRRTGNLGQAMGTKTKMYSSAVVTVIGPRTDFVRKGSAYSRGAHAGEPRTIKPSKYAWLVEKGTRRSRAKPFIAPALASSSSAYRNHLTAEIAAGIQKLGGEGG